MRSKGQCALDNDAGVGEVINIGSNFEISIGDTARAIAEVMDAEISIVTDGQPLRPDNREVERLWADNGKALKLLGWRPEYGEADWFRRGLAETVKWFTEPENPGTYKADRYNV